MNATQAMAAKRRDPEDMRRGFLERIEPIVRAKMAVMDISLPSIIVYPGGLVADGPRESWAQDVLDAYDAQIAAIRREYE